jgi:hypothetical protein
VQIKLFTQEKISAVIKYIKEEKDGSRLIIFEIIKYVEELIDYRKISFDVIWWEFSGIKISKDSIVYDNGIGYVVRNRAGYFDKIAVKVLRENANYAIVDNYSSEELKKLGFTSEEINSMKKVSIYDELVLKPEIIN